MHTDRLSAEGAGTGPLPRRIVVLGGEASGKTTFARQLAARRHLPLHQLDYIAWERVGDGGRSHIPMFEPDYQAPDPVRQRPLAERRRIVDQLAQQPEWVAEGVFLWWTDRLMDRADAIIWLDHVGFATAAKRILLRHARSARREVGLQSGARKFARFGDYARGIRNMLSILRRVYQYHRAPAPAEPAPDDYSAITRAAVAGELLPHAHKLTHLRSSDDVAAYLALVESDELRPERATSR